MDGTALGTVDYMRPCSGTASISLMLAIFVALTNLSLPNQFPTSIG